MSWILELPAVNAMLNGLSAALLTAGYLSIRRKRVALHRALMLSAFTVSTLFLASYLTYHAKAESPKFPGHGWIRPVYFTMLLSHIVLAAGLLPMVLGTLIAALRGRIERHRRLARWTLPIWLYVSVTGVLVYVVLYQVYGAAPTLKSAPLFTTP